MLGWTTRFLIAWRGVLAATVVLLGHSPVCTASNIAFQIRLSFESGPTSRLYWVSLPYSYQPDDAFPNLELDAEDLVQDLQPSGLSRPCTSAEDTCAVKEVWRWNPSTGEYVVWIGGSSAGTPFTLAAGESYGLVIQKVSTITFHVLDVVGAHDPTVEHSVCWQPGAANMLWISLPPHFVSDTTFGDPAILDAEDLGHELGGPERVVQIRRLDPMTGLFENWVVGSVYGSPFPISPDEGYAIDLTCPDPQGGCGQCTWTWIPTHY